MQTPNPVSVLFVCLGNICRSTMAEGVLRAAIQKEERYKGLIKQVDSAGTAAYHTGSPPDERTMAMLKLNGITDYVHRARKVRDSDFVDFDYIFAMDESNLSGLNCHRSSPGSAKIMLWGTYATPPQGNTSNKRTAEVVEDPYYDNSGFRTVYDQCVRFTSNFLEELGNKTQWIE